MIVEEGKYYLYRHIRLDKNEPFYIGIGTKRDDCCSNRSCYSRATNKASRTSFWKNVVKTTDYEVEIILESNDYEFIKQKEIEFIALYGRKDLEKGILVNMTDGGEGQKGRIVSEEWRKNQSDAMKGRPGIKGDLNVNYGKPLPDHVLQKISNSLKGRKFSEEHLKNMSIARKGKPMPFEILRGGDAPNAVKVINILTFEVFSCKKEAAEENNINYNSLSGLLNGRNPNYTDLRYLEDFNNNVEIFKKYLEKTQTFDYNLSIEELRYLFEKEYIDFWSYYPGKKPVNKEIYTEDVVKELILKYQSIKELREDNIALYRLTQNKFSHLIDHLRKDKNKVLLRWSKEEKELLLYYYEIQTKGTEVEKVKNAMQMLYINEIHFNFKERTLSACLNMIYKYK